MLYTAGATPRLGRVDDGTTVTDYDEGEIARKHTLSASLAWAEWNKTKINFIDTPGMGNFLVRCACRPCASPTRRWSSSMPFPASRCRPRGSKPKADRSGCRALSASIASIAGELSLESARTRFHAPKPEAAASSPCSCLHGRRRLFWRSDRPGRPCQGVDLCSNKMAAAKRRRAPVPLAA